VNTKCIKILHIKYKIVESIVKQLSSKPRKLAGGSARWCPLPTSKVTRLFPCISSGQNNNAVSLN
jgi:hypothetical protein